MYRSILFHNLTDEEIDVFTSLLNLDKSEFRIEEIVELTGCERSVVISLVTKQFLEKNKDGITFPSVKDLVTLMVSQEHRYISTAVSEDSDENYLEEVKNYLSTVQKQLTHVDTEARKSFLNLRKMVDKIADQGKEHLNIAFDKALDKNSETGAWVTIPHVSPIGLYEPIEEIKNQFKMIIQELERSLATLIEEYSDYTKQEIRHEISEENDMSQLLDKLESKEQELISETQEFNEEVLIALNEQINLLEKNLGKDLMEQFDAIERLNELKPERIWVMLEETRSELTMYLNNVYSRILREINTLQLNVDISKVSIILTNEAGKAIKKVDEIQQRLIKNLKPLRTLLDDLEE